MLLPNFRRFGVVVIGPQQSEAEDDPLIEVLPLSFVGGAELLDFGGTAILEGNGDAIRPAGTGQRRFRAVLAAGEAGLGRNGQHLVARAAKAEIQQGGGEGDGFGDVQPDRPNRPVRLGGCFALYGVAPGFLAIATADVPRHGHGDLQGRFLRPVKQSFWLGVAIGAIKQDGRVEGGRINGDVSGTKGKDVVEPWESIVQSRPRLFRPRPHFRASDVIERWCFGIRRR